jgi:hypothetical protein
MPHTNSRTAWTTDIAERMRWQFPLKLVGTSVVIGLFFVAYLRLLHHPGFAVTTMPVTAIDRLIPFQPSALFVYLTLWLYVGAGPGLQRNLPDLVACGAWITAMCLTGLAIFYVWPTQVPPLQLDVTGFAGFALLQGIDAAGNACPSMHVAAGTFTLVRVAQVLRQAGAPAWLHLLNAAWFAAIVYSTLAIKQHVLLDALAGALLGGAFALASLRWRPAASAHVQGKRAPTTASRAGRIGETAN